MCNMNDNLSAADYDWLDRKEELSNSSYSTNSSRLYKSDSTPKNISIKKLVAEYQRTDNQKYLNWILSKFEPGFNKIAWNIMEKYSIDNSFEDIKQSCAIGVINALKKYDTSSKMSFWKFCLKYYIPPEVHGCVRQLRPGLSVPSDSNYKTLRKIMWLYNSLEGMSSKERIEEISRKTNLSPDTITEYIISAERNQKLIYTDTPNDDTDKDYPAVQISDPFSDPQNIYLFEERMEKFTDALSMLNERELDIVGSHLGFCPDCFSTVDSKGIPLRTISFEDLATDYELEAESVSRIYYKALGKMKKNL